MNTRRAQILTRVRQALQRNAALPPDVAATLRNRLQQPQTHLQPCITDEPVARFARKATAVGMTLSWIAEYAQLSATLIGYMRQYSAEGKIVVAPDPALTVICDSRHLVIERRAATADDRISLTRAYAGIAESGSLVLLSGGASPTTLNFLPETHMVVLDTDRILMTLEDVWRKMRCEKRAMPRALNCIAGPSRTADIEAIIQKGAHGPRRLHVILVGDRPVTKTAPGAPTAC